MEGPYAGYDVLAKWQDASYDELTREVLRRRLREVPPRRFFSDDEWRVLQAVVARVLPQPDRAEPVPIAPWIDAGLAAGLQEGFRYADMPSAPQAWRTGLAALDAEARLRYDRPFDALDARAADAFLHAIAQGGADPDLWHGLDAKRFFIQILCKRVAEIYYAHPAAWSEIGFGGPASPRGYVRLGFNQRDGWEAREVRWLTS
jgi:hypothetical protein